VPAPIYSFGSYCTSFPRLKRLRTEFKYFSLFVDSVHWTLVQCTMQWIHRNFSLTVCTGQTLKFLGIGIYMYYSCCFIQSLQYLSYTLICKWDLLKYISQQKISQNNLRIRITVGIGQSFAAKLFVCSICKWDIVLQLWEGTGNYWLQCLSYTL